MPILDWLLRETGEIETISSQWADFSIGRKPQGLQERLEFALKRFPCDLLFVHRDSEKQDPKSRYDEIRAAADAANVAITPWIGVVPVRMQEAWLLCDEIAIRNAAGNPNGNAALNLPKLATIEAIPDPKQVLHERLKIASGLSGRRLKKFAATSAATLVTQYAASFSQLRALPSFRRLEVDISRLRDNGWK